MNKIVNEFLLDREKSMSESNLRKPGFTYSACVPFTKRRKIIQNFTETGNLKHIYKNELNKACFS